MAGLDEFINSIGGLNPSPLTVGSTSVVGALLQTTLQVLDTLGGGGGAVPGAPTLPDPLSRVPLPLP